METTVLSIENIEVTLIRKPIKNLHLKITPPLGSVIITAPKRMSEEKIRLFFLSKLSRIQKHINKFKEKPRQTPREYIQGETHYFLGEKYTLNIISNATKSHVEQKEENLNIYVRTESKKNVELAIDKRYRQELMKIIEQLGPKREALLGVKAKERKTRTMKTRRGTCNTRAKRILLNLELIKKPIHCIEYVIIHELVHLIERNHGPKFHAHMDKQLPHWKVIKKELNSGLLGD